MCCFVGEADEQSSRMAFLHFRDCIRFLAGLDSRLKWICVRWAAADGGENVSCAERLKRENGRTAAEKWLEVTSFESTARPVHAVRENTVVH